VVAVDHGSPQLIMSQIVSAEQDVTGGRLTFLPSSCSSRLPIGIVLLVYGTVRLLRSAELAPYRFLGWTFVVSPSSSGSVMAAGATSSGCSVGLSAR